MIRLTLIERLINFLKKICFFSYFNNASETEENEENIDGKEAEGADVESLEKAVEDFNNTVIEAKIKVFKMTLTRLYMLDQKITVFKESFPDSYLFFEGQIKELEKSYKDSLIAAKQDLTFEIDPEKDGEKLAKILILENDVEAFIEKEVKFDIIVKKLQRLIVKLNILYNVSVTHIKSNEREKAITQTMRAICVGDRIIQDFKSCEYLLKDIQLKDEIVGLVSYLSYQIFKLLLRNSDITPIEALKKIVFLAEFDGLEYNALFKAFLEDELKELSNLTQQIQNEECRNILKNEYREFYIQLTCSKDGNQILINTEFWANIFDFESKLFSLLKESGIEKDKIKIKLISRMNIHVTEKDVLVSPKTNTYLTLISIFSKTQDQRITLVLKLLKNISDDVTYKEIYFLLLLFDVLDIVKGVPNELVDDLKKYLEKYPYSSSTLERKKEQVLYSSNSEYIYVFTLEEYEEKLVEELDYLKIDFKNVDNKIFMNEIYFSGLTAVMKSLKTVTAI